MATTFTPPIDLYTESVEDAAATPAARDDQPHPPHDVPAARPALNGDRDQPAIDACHEGLDRVLGW